MFIRGETLSAHSVRPPKIPGWIIGVREFFLPNKRASLQELTSPRPAKRMQLSSSKREYPKKPRRRLHTWLKFSKVSKLLIRTYLFQSYNAFDEFKCTYVPRNIIVNKRQKGLLKSSANFTWSHVQSS